MPQTIYVYDIDKVYKVDIPDFIKLVEIQENKVVFKTDEYFFVVIEGIIFGTWNYYSYDTYKEFVLFYKNLEKSALEIKKCLEQIESLQIKEKLRKDELAKKTGKLSLIL